MFRINILQLTLFTKVLFSIYFIAFKIKYILKYIKTNKYLYNILNIFKNIIIKLNKLTFFIWDKTIFLLINIDFIYI